MSKNTRLDNLDYSTARQADENVFIGIQALRASGEADTLGESAFQDIYLEQDDVITIPEADKIRAWVSTFTSKVDNQNRKALYFEVWSEKEGGWIDIPVAVFRRQPLQCQMSFLWKGNQYGRRLFNLSSDLRRLEELAGKSVRVKDILDLHRPTFKLNGTKIEASNPTVDLCQKVTGADGKDIWESVIGEPADNAVLKWIPREETDPYKELTCYKWELLVEEDKEGKRK